MLPVFQESIGITVSCYRGDLPLLKGCLASIRTNLPSVPICLITHGTFQTDEFRESYEVSVISEDDVDPRLREYSYGYGLTKMVSFWHSPFERFLHIDADAVCWGNFLADAPWQDYDLIFNEPHEVITPFIQRTQYFDPERITPPFHWHGRPFFNSGCFIARRGMLDLEEYLDLLAFKRRDPRAIFTDQGILNLMAFRLIANGRITAMAWPLQAVVPVIPVDELRRRFRFENGHPVVVETDRRLIHWAGPKPLLTRKTAFAEPMTYYRLKHLQGVKSAHRGFGKVGLIAEEMRAHFTGRQDG